MAADWLEREIGRGLQGLIVLRLPGAPAEDTITLTLDIWLEAVRSANIDWTEALDAPRFRAAFKGLFRSCDRWPAPKQLFAELPPRTYPPGLPRPAIQDEQAAQQRQWWHEQCKQLKTKLLTGSF